MDIHRLKDLSHEDRMAVLKDESLTVEEQVYNMPLTDDELAIKKDDLSNAAILKAVIEEELAQVKAEYKEKLEPLKTRINEAIQAIKNRSVERKGPVYKIPDYQNHMVSFVTQEGIVLTSRRMLPEERQFTISHQNKEAI